MSNPNVRYRIEPDQTPIDTGDMFTAAGLPDTCPVERAKMEQEYINGVLDAGGPWGCIIEQKCGACGAWEQVESCWGFDSLEGCERDAQGLVDTVEPAVLADPAAGLLAALQNCESALQEMVDDLCPSGDDAAQSCITNARAAIAAAEAKA